MAIIPSLEPDANDCKLHNSYDVQSCILAGVSLVLGAAVCFYGEQRNILIRFAAIPSNKLCAFVNISRLDLWTYWNSNTILQRSSRVLRMISGSLAKNSFCDAGNDACAAGCLQAAFLEASTTSRSVVFNVLGSFSLINVVQKKSLQLEKEMLKVQVLRPCWPRIQFNNVCNS